MRREVLLWLAILMGPAMWFASMETNFVLAPWVCQWKSRLVPNLISAAAIAIVALFGLLAHHEWREAGAGTADAASPASRPRAMAIGGMVLSGLFVVVIFAQAIPDLFMDACQ